MNKIIVDHYGYQKSCHGEVEYLKISYKSILTQTLT